MELFAKVAHEQNGAVIVVTHDHRALDVFDLIYEMEDGMISQKSKGREIPEHSQERGDQASA